MTRIIPVTISIYPSKTIIKGPYSYFSIQEGFLLNLKTVEEVLNGRVKEKGLGPLDFTVNLTISLLEIYSVYI